MKAGLQNSFLSPVKYNEQVSHQVDKSVGTEELDRVPHEMELGLNSVVAGLEKLTGRCESLETQIGTKLADMEARVVLVESNANMLRAQLDQVSVASAIARDLWEQLSSERAEDVRSPQDQNPTISIRQATPPKAEAHKAQPQPAPEVT